MIIDIHHQQIIIVIIAQLKIYNLILIIKIVSIHSYNKQLIVKPNVHVEEPVLSICSLT